MQGLKRRIIYVTAYEGIAIATTTAAMALLLGVGPAHAGSASVMASAVAIVWNLAFNAFFEAWEARQPEGDHARSLLVEVEQCAPGSRLNFLLTDGDQLFATTWTHALWVRRTRSSVTVASEPFGPAVEWQRVPDRQLLTAVPGRVTMTPIPGTESYD